MGLLDSVLGNVMDSLGKGGAAADGANPLLQMVMNLVQQNGGLAGLVNNLGQHGLAEQVASWVGTGSNLPVSAEQLGQALGGGSLAELASRFGMNSAEVGDGLARYLPEVVNQLTPEGRLPDSDNGLEQGLAALTGKLFG